MCGACFLYTFYVLCNLFYFLSRHNGKIETTNLEGTTAPGVDDAMSPVMQSLLMDISLLSVFMLQHSVMAKNSVNQIFRKLHIEYLDRSIYNIASAAVLHLLITNWEIVPEVSLWKISTSSNMSAWLLFTTIHVLAWAIIYCGCLMMDISDLAGLKQVYYKISGRPNPGAMKSRELLRYYAHLRHPSFTGFLMILWIHPFMTIDRLLMASVLTIYMILMWNVDKADYCYHLSLVKLKEREFF